MTSKPQRQCQGIPSNVEAILRDNYIVVRQTVLQVPGSQRLRAWHYEMYSHAGQFASSEEGQKSEDRALGQPFSQHF